MSLQATTWQTIGPYFRIGLERLYVDDLAAPGVPGERVEIAGRVIDGDGQGVPDALIEIWQADAAGKYAHPEDMQAVDARAQDVQVQDVPVQNVQALNAQAKVDQQTESFVSTAKDAAFRGYGRIPTAPDGSFQFKSIKPGRVSAPAGKLQAPHIVVSVFMRGLLRRLVTRIYFPDDPANAEDFALHVVEPARRETLIARKSPQRENLLEWNVVLQGPNETVFFDF